MDEQIKLAQQWAAEQAKINAAATEEMLWQIECEILVLEERDLFQTQEDARY